MSDCGNCRAYQKSVESGTPLSCYSAVWWGPSQISYCRPQILWYFKYADDFRTGKWLPDPDGTSAVDPSIRSKYARIPSRYAQELAAEIDSRQKMCGIEGKLLEYEIQDNRPFSDTSWKALNYISGWKRKQISYSKWKSHNRPQVVGKK